MKRPRPHRLAAGPCLAALALVAAAPVAAAPVAAAPPTAAAAAAPPTAAAPPAPAATPAPALPAASTPASEERFAAVLAPRPGGLRAADVAARAERESPEVRAKARAVAAAQAQVDQAVAGFVPRVQVVARYLHNSAITPPDLGSLFGLPISVTFPIVLDMYHLQGTLQVPLSDYLLRLTQNHAAATRSKTAARLAEVAARRKVQKDARVAFYNWARARGGEVVAEQALATAREHLKDVRAAVAVGTASRADLLRVESQVAQTELLLERSRNLVQLVTEQLRVLLHDPPGTAYELGEDLRQDPRPRGPARLPDLFAEALAQRPEPRALGATAASLRASGKVVRAGYFPRLDAFANVYQQNPNTRYFPQEEKWHTTWDVGVQLSWTLNDTFVTRSRLREVEARTLEVEAQRAGLLDGLRLEVTQAYTALREAEAALRTTRRQQQAAEESYRVRRDLFRVGRATSTELTDAETELVRARLDRLNARIDARIGSLTLDYALGRDAAPAAPATARGPRRLARR